MVFKESVVVYFSVGPGIHVLRQWNIMRNLMQYEYSLQLAEVQVDMCVTDTPM
jgi:hypothetical protein